MKKKLFGILILLTISLMAQAAGYYTPNQGFVTVDMAAGYQTMLTGNAELHPGIGTGVRLGVGYTYQYSYLLLHAGLEGSYGYMTHKLDAANDTVSCPVNGLPSVRITSLNQRVNAYRQVGVSVPLLIGAQMGATYLLGGIKPALNVWGQESAEAHESSWLDYGGAIDGTMSDKLVFPYGERTRALAMNWQVYAHAELGWRISSSQWSGSYAAARTGYAFALWAEYGILAQPLMNNTQYGHPLSVGAKVTVMMNMDTRNNCRCY